jgi:polysaccharide biosynthesis/export protein
MRNNMEIRAGVHAWSRAFIARAAVALLCLGTAATMAGAQTGSAAPVTKEHYLIGAGDLLKVRIFDDERLSGDFRVSSDGTIGFPLLGQVDVAGLTASQIESQIADAVSQQVPLIGKPTVEILEYAPVYIVGDVSNPGTYQYHPGMIAIELVALAGGSRRGALGKDGYADLITTEQRLNQLSVQQFSYETQRKRLIAEINDKPFDTSPESGQSVLSTNMQQLIIDNEKKLYQTRLDILDNQKKALAAQRAAFAEEIDVLEKSIGLHDDEISLLGKEVDVQQGLFDRGLTVQSRILELKRDYSEIRRDDLELRSFLSRAKQKQLDVDLKVQELLNARASENAEAIRTTDLSLIQVRGDIAALQSLSGEQRQRLNDPVAQVPQGPQFTIIRDENGTRRTIDVDQFAKIEPRDILQVDSGALVSGPDRLSAATN